MEQFEFFDYDDEIVKERTEFIHSGSEREERDVTTTVLLNSEELRSFVSIFTKLLHTRN